MNTSRLTSDTPYNYVARFEALMSNSLSHSDPIIVVGAGVFGLSTAWWLTRVGYHNVRVLDRWPVPSPSSAGYDRNKIIRTEYVDGHFSILSQEAIEFWRDPLWRDVFHPTGKICSSCIQR